MLRIVYTGEIYPKQDEEKLFRAISELLDEGGCEEEEIAVDIYGHGGYGLEGVIEKWGLKEVVRHHGMVSHEKAKEEQREATVLWLMKWEDPDERGVIPGKLFEYLGARRPILVTGGYPDGGVDVVLKDTHAGIWCQGVKEIKEQLKFWVRE